ncbi:hypothetical protein LR48_Vigan01g189800 [Vigna angularis]|uniref:Uncharacterized protein n=1 Tax=Phaseolus angularis TaxID=3914 RepID=A0A0L9TPE7_PHAAN|nr:hypothetical protein LR48_Vigan01g189800 [Vigna angularis]
MFNLQPLETPKPYPIKHNTNKKIIVGDIADAECGFRVEANRSRRLRIHITECIFSLIGDAFGDDQDYRRRRDDERWQWHSVAIWWRALVMEVSTVQESQRVKGETLQVTAAFPAWVRLSAAISADHGGARQHWSKGEPFSF